MKSITTIEERAHMSDGRLHHLIDEEKISHARLFAHITLKPGQEIKMHEHHGEYEIYYILSGTGIYYDNGTEHPIMPGHVTHCKSGNAHSIKNTGEEILEYIALIVVE